MVVSSLLGVKWMRDQSPADSILVVSLRCAHWIASSSHNRLSAQSTLSRCHGRFLLTYPTDKNCLVLTLPYPGEPSSPAFLFPKTAFSIINYFAGFAMPRSLVDENLQGLDCSEPGASVRNLPIKTGYWRASLNSITIRECYSEVSS